ncbi:DUF742 domain-containing protein [Nocardiopsis sediminis]|uniref:DUF742 domain-containing protein n=1 Tax=Nocardiopsis sediminis TaxID=1778267 RepID=A0ABV8FX22_9ACTN
MSASRGAAGTDAGRLVRPFAVHIEEAVPAIGLDMLTRVIATRPPARSEALQPERADALRLARRPLTVAELAARLELPLGVVKPLLAGLIHAGALRLCPPDPAPAPQDNILHLVLEGLRAL